MPGTAVALPFKYCFQIHFIIDYVKIQRALNVVEVIEHELRGFVGVALRDRIGDGGVLVGTAADADRRVVQQDDKTRQRGQFTQAARIRRVASERRREVVEFTGEPDDRTLVVTSTRIHFEAQMFSQLGELLRRDVARQPMHDGRLDQAACFENIASLIH